MMSCLLSINSARITVAVPPRYWIITPKTDELVKFPGGSKRKKKKVPQLWNEAVLGKSLTECPMTSCHILSQGSYFIFKNMLLFYRVHPVAAIAL